MYTEYDVYHKGLESKLTEICNIQVWLCIY